MTSTVFPEGLRFTDAVLGHFASPAPNLTAGDFTVTINWRDGSNNDSTDGHGAIAVVPNPLGGFNVVGSHTYARFGYYAAAISVGYAGGTVALKRNVAVADQPLSPLNPAGFIPPPVMTLTPSLQDAVLYHFLAPGSGLTVADFQATVYWGDGTSNGTGDGTGQVSVAADPEGGFRVVRTHDYDPAVKGAVYAVRVTTANGAVLTNPVLFHFTDADPQGRANDFRVTVVWGDGTDSDADNSAYVVANPSGGFNVYGTHTYGATAPGAAFGVIVRSFFGSKTGASSATLNVADPAVTPAGVALSNVVQGRALGPVVVATFTDPGLPLDATGYTVDIDWGDGTPVQRGTVVRGSGNQYQVLGSHTYTRIGNQTVTVTIRHGRAPAAQAVSTAPVFDPPVAAAGGQSLSGTEGAALSNKLLATFTDPSGADRLGNYMVTIDWSGGTSTPSAPVGFAANPQWAFGSRLPVASGPVAAVAADFDGDGKPDLAVASALSESVQIARGNGDGTFQDPQTYQLGVRPAWLAVGDLNGDGKPDMVTANPGANSVSILLNTGTGALGSAASFGTGANGVSPNHVALADLNADGRLDVVTANSASDTVSVLLGNGNGTFQSAVSLAVGGRGPTAVAVGDINGDLRADLVVANAQSNQVGLLPGNGNGTFQSAKTLAVGLSPLSVALADLRGAGLRDIVTANGVDKKVSVLLNNGSGTFQAAVDYAVGDTPVAVLARDVNGDGRPDLITANNADTAAGNNVSVLHGNGNGTFQTATAYGVGRGPTSVAAADLNGDGRPELIATNSADDDVSLLLPAYAVVAGHTYADSGTYQITATIRNAGGNTVTASTTVAVSNVDPTPANDGPKAARQYSDFIVPVAGDITKAKVRFLIYDGEDTTQLVHDSGQLDVALVGPLTGRVAYNYEFDIRNADSREFLIRTVVEGRYTGNSDLDDVMLTVAWAQPNSIAGGGYLVNEASAGVYAGAAGAKTNFGFNVKFNKNLTNLQGRVNLIVRGADGRVYQIKSTALESLSVPAKTRDSDPALATFTSKANIQDITDPRNPISLVGNGRMQVTMTDRGDPGTADSIAITVWNSQGTQLLFSSRWIGNNTVEQFLAGGNVQVRAANPLRAAGGPVPDPSGGVGLTAEELRPLVGEAISRWAAAGLGAADLETLSRAWVLVADLEEGYLGFASSDTVWVDADAAGYGWFVDPTPREDSEFALAGDQGEQGRVDLLSTIAHELGHLLGLADLTGEHHADDLMGEALTPGTRRLPTAAVVAAATGEDRGTPATLPAVIAHVMSAGEMPADPSVYWQSASAIAPVPTDPSPPLLRVAKRVQEGVAVADQRGTGGVDPSVMPLRPGESVVRLPGPMDCGVGTYWAVDLGDRP